MPRPLNQSRTKTMALRCAPVIAASAFAADIDARYRARSVGCRRVARELLAVRTPRWTHLARHLHLHVTPRIHILARAAARGSRAPLVASPREPGMGPRAPALAPVIRRRSRLAFSHGRRLPETESGSGHPVEAAPVRRSMEPTGRLRGDADLPRQRGDHAAARVERVVHRPNTAASPRAGEGAGARDPASSVTLDAQARVPAARPPGAAAAPVDVERLADRVVKVLDRRTISARERLGRM